MYSTKSPDLRVRVINRHEKARECNHTDADQGISPFYLYASGRGEMTP